VTDERPHDATPDLLTETRCRLVDAFPRLPPRQQRILGKALRRCASGLPGAGLLRAVDR